MFKAKIFKKRSVYKTRIRARKTSPREAAVLMARICESVCEAIPEMTPEKMLEAVALAIRLDAEEETERGSGKDGGLTVRCHKPQMECQHFDYEDGWCNRFDRPCAEVHDDGEAEDE